MVTRRQFIKGIGAIGAAGGASLAGAASVSAETWSEQRVSPDTCSCVFVEEWDQEADPATRITRLVRFERRGPEHAHITDDSLYPVIRDENRRKNMAQNKAAELSGLSFEDVNWVFDPGRTLEIRWPGRNIPAQIKSSVQAWCDDNLGIGKVLVL